MTMDRLDIYQWQYRLSGYRFVWTLLQYGNRLDLFDFSSGIFYACAFCQQ